uniref:NAC domain-containing protein 82-like n=1 Tax=Erigeron canadensis TaxID=72917 RepID=UPI001CB8B5BF|nr:NAC domain-containing protein 82-like [Erigeron canadensis]
MKKSSLCPGFRFHPTDVELVMYYLKRKLLGKKMVPEVIAEVNIYDFSPWDLPDKSSLRNGDLEWFFFCPKSKKYPNGSRMNRATKAGYWKASGKDREVKYKERTVAMIKTLIFHMGHPPKGTRTDWVMHEYRMEDKNLANEGVVQEAYALCRLFEKSGAGPKNGAQYGAPFEEEEWVDEDDESGLSGAAATEIVNPIRTSSAYTNMTFYVPGPSTATSSENMRHMDKFTVTSSEALSVSGATKTSTSYASGSASAMTDPSLAEPDPAAITVSEIERYLDKSTVTTSAVFGLSGASEVPVPLARDLTVMNMTSTEPGPFTITSLTNERNHLPAKNDAMPTSELIASIFHDNNTLEVENRNGNNIVTDAPNHDDFVLDSAALSTLDDLSLDGFDMFYDDGSTNSMMEAFLLDNLDDDLGNFF